MGKFLIAPLSSSNINSSPTASPLHHRPVSAPRTCVPELHIQSEHMICGRSRGFSGLLSLVVQAHKKIEETITSRAHVDFWTNLHQQTHCKPSQPELRWGGPACPFCPLQHLCITTPNKNKEHYTQNTLLRDTNCLQEKKFMMPSNKYHLAICHTFCHIHLENKNQCCQGHFLAKLPRPTASSPTSRKKWIPLWGVSWNLACSQITPPKIDMVYLKMMESLEDDFPDFQGCILRFHVNLPVCMMLGRNGSFIFQISNPNLSCWPACQDP